MALTATATVATRDSVVKILGMNSPTIVSASPEKPKICYAVREKGNIEEVFSPLLNTLCSTRCQMPRVIIYCRKVEHCSQLYRFFLSAMKYEFTEPPGAPNIAMFRLVDMFTSVTRNSVKESIIASLQKRHAPLRIVICTNAFGMGVDCTDVCQVIHWGSPSDIESYVQECGRASRNSQPAQAVLFKRLTSEHIVPKTCNRTALETMCAEELDSCHTLTARMIVIMTAVAVMCVLVTFIVINVIVIHFQCNYFTMSE